MPSTGTRQTLLRVAIWLATAICVAMLFVPLLRDLVVRIGSRPAGGPP